MEEPNTEILIPARQDTIQFQEKPLVVVRLPDEQPGVVLRWVCENLHLAIHGQVERIKRTEVNDPRREAPGHGVRPMPVVVQPICRSH